MHRCRRNWKTAGGNGLDLSGTDSSKKQQRGTFAPLQAAELSEIRKKEDLYRETGLKALREGKVGAILLAGGQGTRLGFDKARGMFNIGVTKTLYIFEQLIKI